MKTKDKIVSSLKLLQKAYSDYKWPILILVIFGFINGLLEGIGVNALIPLFSFAIGEGEGGPDLISRGLQDFFSFLNFDLSVTVLLVFITSLFIVKAFINIFLIYIKTKITSDYQEKVRNSLFSKMLNASWPYLIKQRLGYLETILMVDVPYGASLLNQLSAAIVLVTGLFIYLVVAVNISLPITVFTLALGAIFFLTIKPIIAKTKASSYKITESNKEISHHVNENILGMKTVKSMNVEAAVAEKGKNYFAHLKKLVLKISILKGVTGSFLQPVALIFVSVIFVLTYKVPDFNLAVLIVIVYLIQKIFTYIQQLETAMHTVVEMVPHLKSVLDYEDQVIEYKEIDEGKREFIFRDKIEFKNINFSYHVSRPVFSGIDFEINKGEMVGLIGPSGVGKTTLVDLILRLLKPASGKILIDGTEISDVSLKSWRKKIGYVSQDIFLINDTIANNIKFYDNAVSQRDIETAAQQANIYEFVESLPDKFETVIGDRGILISAGQRQRIVITRILARDPQLLILDEATSALDNESEVQIQKIIRGLKGKITVLAIAHRLSTVMDSDRLIVLEKGKIIEQGPPKELLKNKDSYFFKVYNIKQ